MPLPPVPATFPQLTFRLCPGQTPLKTVAGLTLSPAGGIRVTVHRR